jgi:hypothetical protein
MINLYVKGKKDASFAPGAEAAGLNEDKPKGLYIQP